MPDAPASPSRPRIAGAFYLLLVLALIGALTLHLLACRRQAQALDLQRLETQVLTQEIRLLRQQLEAERILSAARAHSAVVESPETPGP